MSDNHSRNQGLISLLDELQNIVDVWLAENPTQSTTWEDCGRVMGHQECAETVQSIINRHTLEQHNEER